MGMKEGRLEFITLVASMTGKCTLRTIQSKATNMHLRSTLIPN